MSNFQNFNYQNYQQQPPTPPEEPGFLEKVFGSEVASTMRSPLFATAALLIAGVAFGAIIIAGYPDDEEAVVPIVQAEAGAFKEIPGDRGGLSIDNQDSTVFSSLSDPEAQIDEPAPVENLLASNDEIDRLEAFKAEADKVIEEAEGEEKEAINLIDQATGVEGSEPLTVASVPVATRESETVSPDDLIEKVEDEPAPAESPETLAFVQDVLNKKDAKSDDTTASAEATAAASVQPAAGFSNVGPGTHYIQLGSVKTASGASSEWSKIQAKYPDELTGLKYRVERADLGEKGVFYRIQAGPMSGESAGQLCDSIKAQSPGACLVTK